jgi:rod shape-determining protein MreD
MKRLIVIVAVLAVALLAQLTFVNGLPLPGGGAPDLVLLCVVAIGLTAGTETGLITGFLAGLALDLAPPANELIGQYALVFCLIGYGSGKMRFTLRRSAMLAFVTAAVAAVAGEVLAACLVLVLDTPAVTLAAVLQVLPSTLLYDLVLSPVVLFAAVRIATGLGVSFNPQDDSPALEPGGSAAPVGLAGLGWRRAPNIGLGGAVTGGRGGDGVTAGSGSWLTGDSVAAVAAVGSVGWLRGPAKSRRQRREQARVTAALTGAAPRKGAFWVGSRPAGLQHVTPAVSTPSGLSRLRPESGVAGSAAREGLPPAALPNREPKIDFAGGGTGLAGGTGAGGFGGISGSGVSGRKTPKIAFGTGALPGTGRPRGRGPAKINFSGDSLGGRRGGLAGRSGLVGGGGLAGRRGDGVVGTGGGWAARGGDGVAGTGGGWAGRDSDGVVGTGGGLTAGGLTGAGLTGGGLTGGGLTGAGGGLAGTGGIGAGGIGASSFEADGLGYDAMPRARFGTGSLPGSRRVLKSGRGGRGGRGGGPRISFGSGLPGGRRSSSGRLARPNFRSGSARSATGPWLAGSRFRSADLGHGGLGSVGPAKGPSLGGTSSSYGLRRSHWPRTAKMRRKRAVRRWLWWLR